ncbi:hypothetical protein QNI19_03160 [Cytophagaceae bacterium DM2B3-1]|uniref:Uncharacterized protein n=1 Tax=Xanthocytophaga flava TaxID=3048013 RepID=A0ABT7CEG6_9BACT|nr:hypothetical protein [Xanthocytophaga flavus]MDJ1491916.1 hypothetical protein [Xanthocytophaga flavus]
MTPYNFQLTAFYEDGKSANLEAFSEITITETELPICSTYISIDQWTLLTTQRIISKEGVVVHEHTIESFKQKFSGNFKGLGGKKVETGRLELLTGEICPYYIETGAASMVMIYDIQTIQQINPKSQIDLEVMEKRYKKRGFLEG